MENAIIEKIEKFENEGGIISATVHYVNRQGVRCFSRHYTLEETKLFAKIYREQSKNGKVKVRIIFNGEEAIIED